VSNYSILRNKRKKRPKLNKKCRLRSRTFWCVILWVNKRKQRTFVGRTFRIPVFAVPRLRYKLQNRIGQRYITRTLGGIKLNRQSRTFDTLISQNFPCCAMEMSVHPSPDVQESSRGVTSLVVGYNGMKNSTLDQVKSFVALRQGRIIICIV